MIPTLAYSIIIRISLVVHNFLSQQTDEQGIFTCCLVKKGSKMCAVIIHIQLIKKDQKRYEM